MAKTDHLSQCGSLVRGLPTAIMIAVDGPGDHLQWETNWCDRAHNFKKSYKILENIFKCFQRIFSF